MRFVNRSLLGYTLYMNLDFDQQAGARLAREFIEWAQAVIEAPVRLEDEEDV